MPTEWKAHLPDPAKTNEMTNEEKVLTGVIEAKEALITELATELRRLKRENLRVKMHMMELVARPHSRTAAKIKNRYQGEANMSESILFYN